MSERPIADLSDDRLERWVAFEIHRARSAFKAGADERDAEIVAAMGEKTGARVKALLARIDDVGTGLAAATIASARTYKAGPDSIEAARLLVLGFVEEVSKRALYMAHVVDPGRAVKDITLARAASLKDAISGKFALTTEGTSAPRPTEVGPSRQGMEFLVSNNVSARPAHRPLKWPEALRIFPDRLVAGSTVRNRSDEARKIFNSWGKPNPPAPKSIAGWIADYHDQCEWVDGKITNGAAIAALVEVYKSEKALKSF